MKKQSNSLRSRLRNFLPPIFEGVVVSLFILAYVIPIGWILLTAFKPVDKVYSLSVFFKPTLENFKVVFSTLEGTKSFFPYLLNSLTVTGVTLAITTPVGILAAYTLSRFKLRGKHFVLFWILSTQFVPPIVIVLPFFLMFRNLGLLDSRIGLIIVNLGYIVPYVVWMSKGFIDSIPTDIEESARIDGCTRFQVIYKIILPLAKPGIITSMAFSFVLAWNEFLFALILTNQTAVTMPVGLMTLSGERGVHWEQMAAAGLVLIIPPTLFMLYGRKHFVQGLTRGALD